MNPVNAVPQISRLLSLWNQDNKGSRRVVFDGFYFFTPIQERIIRFIIEAGYEPIFIFPYRKEHPLANQIWDELYSERYGYQSKDQWTFIRSDSGNDFGELLEGRPTEMASCNLREYHNVMGMVDDLRKIKGRMNMYSPNANDANSILQDFFPERYGLKKLSSYPIGAFIRTLHHMWDEDSQSLFLDEQLLMDSFVSGWISYNGISSDMAISDLEKVLPFFKGCSTIDDWRNRSQLLNTIHNSIMARFEPQSEDPVEKRWLRILDDPLGNFGVFDVERHRVELIIGLIGNLIDCARFLFGEGEGRSFNDHFSRLLRILKDNGIKEGQQQELTLAAEYIRSLSNRDYPEKYNPSDLINAIIAFLDNEAPVNEDGDSMEWVRPLYDIEGNDGPVHICLGDHLSLPGKSKGYVWPLTDELMDSISSRQAEKDEHPLIDNTIFITVCNPVANRYLVYSAFDSGSVTLSWISEDNGKKLAPSPYISLISKMCGKGVTPFKPYRGTTKRIEDIPAGEELVEPFIIPADHNIPEVNMDTSLCPRRYLYGYVLDDRPSFDSEFHYGFAIGGLISALRSVQKTGGFPKDQIEPSVFSLFPFISDIERRNITDRIPQTKFEDWTRYHDMRFTDMRLGIHFPRPTWDLIENNLSSLRLDKPLDVLRSSQDEIPCVYCPHSQVCPHSQSSGDQDD